jgi:alpha-ketoglutarate-dependent taurine dioxygenase
MVPTVLMFLDTLPLTPNGKVDRRALPAPLQSAPGETFVAPRTATEARLAALWTDILRLERIGVHDNFFALGGHSLLATQVMARIGATFQVELPLRTLFEAPTVARLAERLETARQAGEQAQRPPISRVPRTGPLPLAFAQQRLWVLDQLAPGDPVYNGAAALRLVGPLNIPALAQTFNEILRRHEVLRTIFTTVEEQPVQIILQAQPLRLLEVDLRQVPAAAREQVVHHLLTAAARQPFDLAHGPLLRVSVLHLHATEHVLVLAMHHIVSDGWSTGVLIREVAALYTAYTTGAPSPLPELPLQYADFAHWQRQWLQGEVLETRLAYWRRQLAGAPAVLELPTDRPRSPVQTFRGARQTLRLSSDLTEQLRALGQQEGATLFMTLLAAFNVMLQASTGRDDMIVGTDVANRHHADLEGLIGFFVNILVLRTDMRGNPTFREFLRQVRQVVLSAYDHQDLPFEQLVAALQPARNVHHAPLVQVLCVLQNTPQPTPDLPEIQVYPQEVHSGTARFDLGLFIQETPQGLLGTWNYNTDLFDATTITRLSEHFATLLEHIVAQPEARLHRLTLLTEAAQKGRNMEDARHAAASFTRFKNIKPKAVHLRPKTVVRIDALQPGATLPLVLQPAADHVDLVGWASANRPFIDTRLSLHGALLFRGFQVPSVQEFERFAQALCPDLFGEYGDLPREEMGHKVYHSTPYPPEQAILFHNEASHTHQWPLKQWFYCVQAARQHGETPLVDCRKVYQDLDAYVRQRFEHKQLMYVRNFVQGLDVSWQEFFHTPERSLVEDYCRRAAVDCTWLENDGLRTRQICPAVTRHPKTGETVFFNQIQLHHSACLDPSVRASLVAMFGEEGLPRNVYYGDGSPIEEAVVTEICAIYQRQASSFPWQAMDILMVDNMLVAHGRQPFVGPRKIVVAMGEMICRADV